MAGRRPLTTAAALVVALAAAACGDDGEPSATPGTTASTTTVATTATTTATTTLAVTRECGLVGFTPNSEDAASDIRAIGVTCDEARAFVRIAGRRTSSGGPQSLEVEGWRCEVTATSVDPLPTSDYRCTEGAATVTFVRS
jgi:hypothetical protein